MNFTDESAVQIIPISASLLDARQEKFTKAIEEIIHIVKEFKIFDDYSEEVSAIMVKDIDYVSDFQQLWRPPITGRDYSFLVVSVNFAPFIRNIEDAEHERLESFRFASCFAQYVADILFATHIALPGILDASPGFLFMGANGDRIPTDGMSSDLSRVVLKAKEYNWPPILDLSVIQVLQWLHRLPGFTQGLGKGAVGRAVAALSYLINLQGSAFDTNELDLIWALLGLEAVYGRESAGSKTQLLQKSEVLLGKRKTHKKILGRIYDTRSRLLHGDLDIPLGYYNQLGYDNSRTYDFLKQQEEDILFATSVLLSTIQHLIVENRHSIQFSYIISDD